MSMTLRPLQKILNCPFEEVFRFWSGYWVKENMKNGSLQKKNTKLRKI